jgi:hypothetical protein
MSTTTAQYPKDPDYVWLAVDDSRHVGLLFSLGKGPVPGAVIASGGLTGDALLEQLAKLKKVGTAELQFPSDAVKNATELAALGFYVAEWTGDKPQRAVRSGVYEIGQAPSYPLSVDQLPEELSKLAYVSYLEGINFPAARQGGVPVKGVTP